MQAQILHKMILYFGNDVRRINHALKVYGFAQSIAQGENLTAEELQITEIAAILHDIGIHEAERKYNSSSGKYQEIEGPGVAQQLLKDCGLQSEIMKRVLFLIANHHSYSKIDGTDFQILVEADFLVNIFEDNFPLESVHTIRKKYFKTQTGISLLESMYFSENLA